MATFRVVKKAMVRGFENVFAGKLADVGARGMASLTMRGLAGLVQKDEALAQTLFDAIKASENKAEFSGGVMEAILEAIKKTPFGASVPIRGFMSLLQNFIDKGIVHYYDELKVLEFDQFKARIVDVMDDAVSTLVPESGKVFCLGVAPGLTIAFRDEDDENIGPTKGMYGGRQIVVVSKEKDVKFTEVNIPGGTVNGFWMDFDRAIASSLVVPHPLSFPDLVWGMHMRSGGGGDKKNVWDELNEAERQQVAKNLRKLLKARGYKSEVVLTDKIEQIARKCPSAEVLKALAGKKLKVTEIEILLTIAGGHASADMVAMQQVHTLLTFAGETASDIKAAFKEAWPQLVRYVDEKKLVERTIGHGKRSFICAGVSMITFVVISLLHERQMRFGFRVGLTGLSFIGNLYFTGWLLWVAGLFKAGELVWKGLGEGLGTIVDAVYAVTKSEKPKEEEDPKGQIYAPDNVLSTAGLLYFVYTGLATLFMATTYLDEAIKALYDLGLALRFAGVMWMIAVAVSEAYSMAIWKATLEARVSAAKKVATVRWFIQVAVEKPSILLMFGAPVLVVVLVFFGAPVIDKTGLYPIQEMQDKLVRVAPGEYASAEAVFGDYARQETWVNSVNNLFHASSGVRQFPEYVFGEDKTVNGRRWIEFDVDTVNRVVYGKSHFKSAIRVVSVNGFNTATLMDGYVLDDLDATFPDRIKDGEKKPVEYQGFVRIPKEKVEEYRRTRRGTNDLRIDFTYTDDGLVYASDCDPGHNGSAGAAVVSGLRGWVEKKGSSVYLIVGVLAVVGMWALPSKEDTGVVKNGRIAFAGILLSVAMLIGFAALIF